MKQSQQGARFFMGSNTSDGFYSYFPDLQDPKTKMALVLLKGGPGTGKSTLMKRLIADYPTFHETIYCASDPDSLDAILLSDAGYTILDATPPHALEPHYPLSVETLLDLASGADVSAMQQQRDEVISITDAISGHHRHFCTLLKSANLLYDNNRSLIVPHINQEKLMKQSLRLADRKFKKAARGLEKRRLLSAFTPKGLLRFEDTVSQLCDEVLLLHDEARVCAPRMLAILREHLLKEQVEFYSCYSPYAAGEELEGILIPSISYGVLTVTKTLPYAQDGKLLHTTRFIAPEIFRQKKQRLSFCRKTAEALLEDGIASLQKAKELHDVLEAHYRPYMDFSVADQAYAKLSENIRRTF